jgi:SAM-dependent methyltransferase
MLRIAAACPHLSFTGLEPLHGYVSFAETAARPRGLTNVRFLVGRCEGAYQLFEQDDPFDRVYSTDVIHHFADEEIAVSSLAQVTRPGGTWLAFEPSWLNPYIFTFQSRTPGERNFRPRRFLALARKHGWDLVQKRYMTLIPSLIPDPPTWLKQIEAACEGLPIVSGRIALTLRRR